MIFCMCAVLLWQKGQAYFEQVLNNPSMMPCDISFESLLFLADAAYEQQVGKPFDYQPTSNYETYSNKKGWQL